jgi:hypothetical protein
LSERHAYKDTLAEPRCKAAPHEGEIKGATWKEDRLCEDTLEFPYKALVTVMPLKSV